MDYSFFMRGALDLAGRALTVAERHATVAEGRLAWDKVDRWKARFAEQDDPPPPPEAACTCGAVRSDGPAVFFDPLHAPQAPQRTWTLHLDGDTLVLTDGVVTSRVPYAARS